MNIKDDITAKAVAIETALSNYLPERDPDTAVLRESMEYALMSGGKRIRPYLTLAFCELFGGETNAAMPYACAVEMIHNYSLAHDDLPCMDNDDMRRGKPTCHKKFGETTALLAGDALLTEAFSVISNNDMLSAEKNIKAVAILARAAGADGMVGGQVMDLEDKKNGGFDRLIKLHSKKTGAMICAAVQLGCIAAGLSESSEEFSDSTAYAERIGLTFQIVDDILDHREGESAEEKETFFSYLDEKASYEYAKRLTDEAVTLIEKHRDSEKLVALARYLLDREI